MRLSKIMRVHKEQIGFTLIEIVVSIAILGIVGSAITSSIFQIYNGNTRGTSRMTVITEIENAVHCITPDAQMAQTVTVTDPSGFPLTLNWVEWNGTVVSVIYRFQNGQLQRIYSENSGTPTTSIVARNIDPTQTSCTVNGAILTFKITSVIGIFKPETSLFTILLRSAS
jgi:prepilin-type N-terminal cleavage/methylation domain-containing protein